MIDNTIIIESSKRNKPRVAKVYVTYETLDRDYDKIDEVINAVEITEVFKTYNENNELLLTATDEFPNAIQYNRIFFVDAYGQVETTLNIETKTQRLVRIDLKLIYVSEHTIGIGVCS